MLSDYKLEGLVRVHSGKLLIIDPCYLAEFDDSVFDKVRVRDAETWGLLEDVEDLTNGKIEQSEFSRRREEAGKKPSFCPPYLLEFEKFVIFRNGIGDGDFPITASKKRIYLDCRGAADAGAINNGLKANHFYLGKSSADTGTHIVTDAVDFRIGKDADEKLYCKINVENGIYAVRFIQRNDMVSIRRQAFSY